MRSLLKPKEKREKIKINTKQKKWTLFKITIACKDKNSKIPLKIEDILNKEYIHNAAAENNNEINEDENNIVTGQNNINIKDQDLNAFIVEDSDVNFIVREMGENDNDNNIINEENNKEGGNKTYYYVLIKDITTMKNEQDKYVPLFNALEKTAKDKNFTYSIEIIDANTTEVTNMRSMFDGCEKLTEIKGLDKWNTGNVTDMSWMFYGCKELTEIEGLENWKTDNVTAMKCMFAWCKSLKSLPDISKWNTSNVKNMSSMFWEWGM